MKVVLRLTLSIIVIVSIFSIAKTSPVYAAGQSLSFTTSPVTLGINLKPGGSITEQLQLMNNGDQPVPIVMQIKNFGARGSDGQAAVSDYLPNDPANSYIKFSPSKFTAQPKVWSKVTATITLPQTAQLGYYYAIVFQPEINVVAGGGATVKGDNAILALIDTGSSNESKNAVVSSFTVNHGLSEYLPVDFNINIRNNGNIFLAPSGDIFISRHANGTGTIDTIAVNAASGNILPNSNRIFSSSWTDGFPVFTSKYVKGKLVTDKQSNPLLQLKWDTSKVNKLRFGHYYAKLALGYNNGKEVVLLNSVVSFWVIPWKLLIVALILLGLFLIGIWLIIRAIFRKFRGGKKHSRRFRR